MDTTTLEQYIASTSTVSLDTSIENYPVFIIQNSSCSAKIALHGAHLYEWTPTGQSPVIYTSPTAIFQEGKAIRGGVPVCWPWFNAHPTDSSKPSHGFVRNRFWTLTSASESEESTTLTFTVSSENEYVATVTITVGAQATVQITSENTGSEPLTIGGALHTYLCVSNIADVSISGLENTNYIDTVGTEALREQQGEITISEEVDRIYIDTSSDILLRDATRTLRVERSGSQSAVVWNPWIEKAKGLGDLPDEAYHDFVCIEAANARDDIYEVLPGESHTLATTISVA